MREIVESARCSLSQWVRSSRRSASSTWHAYVEFRLPSNRNYLIDGMASEPREDVGDGVLGAVEVLDFDPVLH